MKGVNELHVILFQPKLNTASSENNSHDKYTWNTNAPNTDFIKKKYDMFILSGLPAKAPD